MIEIIHTSSENQDFKNLVEKLDEYLAIVDGEDHDFYHQFNGIEMLKNCIVLYENQIPVGCGAIKPFDENSAEVKRMFVLPEFRGKGYASKILTELENKAKELGFKDTILETGVRQTDAIKLYEKTYERIPNYGQYEGVEDSVCFMKELKGKEQKT